MPWEEAVTRRIAAGVTRARKARGWNVQRLSDECQARTGVTVSRGSIAKLESGERKVITVPEWLALSYALDAPPIAVLFPFGAVDTFNIVPAAADSPAVEVFAWLTGEASDPPGETVDDEAAWRRAAAPLRLLHRFAGVVDHAHGLLEDEAAGIFAVRRDESGQPTARELERANDLRREWSRVLRQIETLRQEFVANGWVAPALPEDLRHAAEERAEGGGNAKVVE